MAEKLMDDFVELKNFSKIYSKGKEKITGCKNVNLKAQRGKVTGLLGLNGAGKSTILKALAGLHYASEGSVSVFGNDDNAFIRSVSGYVPEFPQSDPSLTVEETLIFEGQLYNLGENQIKENVENAIKLFDLDTVRFQKVSTLSKGYLQRTVFAKVLSFDPQVLILDEFSTGLDPAQIVSMKKTIKTLAKDKVVILSTHHIDEASALCDYIYIISKGSVAAEGTIEEILSLTKKNNLEDAFISLTKKD